MLPLTNPTKSQATGNLLSTTSVLPGKIAATAQEQSGEQQTAALLDLSVLLEQPYPEDAPQEAVASLLSQETEMPLTDLTQAGGAQTGSATPAQQLFQSQQTAILAAGYSQSQPLLPHTFIHQAMLAASPQITSTAEFGRATPVNMPLPAALIQGSAVIPEVLGQSLAQNGTLPSAQISQPGLQSGSSLPAAVAASLTMQAPAQAVSAAVVAAALTPLTSPLPVAALGQMEGGQQPSMATVATGNTRGAEDNTAAVQRLLSAEKSQTAILGASASSRSSQLLPASQSGAVLSAAALSLTADSGAAVLVQSAGGNAPVNSPHQWQSEPMPSDPARFGQKLVALLSDKVDIQLGLGVNRAMIRLDPPALGSIDLSLQFEGEKLTVLLNSSNGPLKEAMQQGLEQLRANLQLKLGADTLIELRMGADNQSQQQRERQTQLTDEIAANIAGVEQIESPDAVAAVTTGLVNQLV
ncbi:flagellar hook-length control protein FliK [Rheinheimera sp.]|uniref:flagellar hook-length control protein FliK n=1 Tax=Rheinheimera sp. TaxID=1869214 RepID=UPI002FDDFE47